MKVLVTGVGGFIGHTLAQELIRAGHDIVGIDSLNNYYEPALKRSNIEILRGNHFSFIHGDLNEMELSTMLDDVEVVYHQAGQPGVRKSWGDDFSSYANANILATQRLLEACRRAPTLARFVYASSSSVYGEASSYPTTEASATAPMSPYGVTKLAGEHLCTLYGTVFGVPTVSLRYFTVYGPTQRPDMAFTRFCRAAIHGDEIRIFGDGNQVRDFTYVSDVVDANIAASTAHVAPGSVFNVSGGTNISVNSCLGLIEERANRSLNVAYLPVEAGDVPRTGGDSTKARKSLGWTPRVSITEGLDRQISWLRSVA